MQIATTIKDPDFHSDLWASLETAHRTSILAQLDAIRSAPARGLTTWFQTAAPALGLKPGGLKAKYYALTRSGDWKVLIDGRKADPATVALARTRESRFIHFLVGLAEENQRKSLPAIRELWRLWRTREKQIPGYEDWPAWPALPEGWGKRNLQEIIRLHTTKAAERSMRVGTSSKTNDFLPHVITTRVGLWPGAVIQLDDMWHDSYVTVTRGTKPVFARVLELAAMDLFSAHRFHFGCMPRLRREDGTMRNIGGREGRLFLAGLIHRFGYCPRGMSFMVEHQTMSIPEEIEKLLYDYSAGWIRVNRQPIEAKQAALTGYWHGSEGGNFRAKALIESIGNLIHNDLGRLAMQTGSPSSGLLGPVATERHLRWMQKAIDKIAAINPKRLEGFRTGTLDYFSQFLPFLTDYYEHGLGMRDDHQLEGWEQLDHFAREYTPMPGTEHWLAESMIMSQDFDAESRAIILAAARSAPDKWSRRRKLRPAEVWNTRGDWTPAPVALICDILTQDYAREVRAENGFLTFRDKDIAPAPLVYEARYISGPRRGERIGHHDKVLMYAMPFDDRTAIAVDARGRFQGELPLAKRVLTIDPSAFGSDKSFEDRPRLTSDELIRAAGEKHAATSEILAPVRIRHAEKSTEAQALRAEAKHLMDPKAAITPDEITAASTARAVSRTTAAASDLAEEALSHIPRTPDPTHTDDLDF